jgi:hypothetical protein
MNTIPVELIEQAVSILGRTGIANDEIEFEVLSITQDQMLARRLIDWIAEAFGMVLVGHISPGIILPTTFSAKSSKGKWFELKFAVEPIFVEAIKIAQRIHHEGPEDLFLNIAARGSIANTVSNALTAGASLNGAVLSGPALIGIPAETYPAPIQNIWSKFFKGLLSRFS